MKQTAVQWLVEKLMKGDFVNNPDELIEQAKEMEKEQIKDAWKHGNIPTFLGRVLTAEQYYKETYD
jgi:hypothetical protein